MKLTSTCLLICIAFSSSCESARTSSEPASTSANPSSAISSTTNSMPADTSGAATTNTQTSSAGTTNPRQPTLIVLDKSDATARFFDANTRTLKHTSATGVGPHEVACRNAIAVVCDYGEQQGGNTLTVLDVATGKLVRTIDLGTHRRPHGIEWIDDTDVIVTVEQSQAILRVDVERGVVEGAYETGQKASHMVVLRPDRQLAFVANIMSDTVTAIDLVTGAVRAQIPTGKGPEAIDVTPDGREVWVGNRSGDSLTVIDAERLDVVATIECAKFPIRLKCTPDGKHVLVSCAQSGDLAVFDTSTRQEIRRVKMELKATETSADYLFGKELGDGPLPIGILIEPKGLRAWVANTNADLVTEIDLTSWEIVARIPTGRQPDGLGWSD